MITRKKISKKSPSKQNSKKKRARTRQAPGSVQKPPTLIRLNSEFADGGYRTHALRLARMETVNLLL